MKSRQPVDRVFTFASAGTSYSMNTRPTDYAVNALVRYGRLRTGHTADGQSTFVSPPVRDGAANSTTVSDDVSTTFSGLANMLRQRALLTSMVSAFAGRTSGDSISRGRDFGSSLMTLRAALRLPDSVSLPGNQELRSFAEYDRHDREVYLALFLAALGSRGSVKWDETTASARTYESILVDPTSIPLLVAEGWLYSKVAFGVQSLKASREPTGNIEGDVNSMFRKLSDVLTTAGQKAWAAGRVVEIAAYAARGGYANLPQQQFLAFSSAVNFVASGDAIGNSNYVDAQVIGQSVPDLIAALKAHPDVREMTTREYQDMFTLRHYFVHRGDRVVLTTVDRNYAHAAVPSRAFGKSDEKPFGHTIVTPASDDLPVGRIDELIASVAKAFDDQLASVAEGAFKEGEAVRAVMSSATRAELRTLAACIAGEVEFSSADADPGSELRVSYLMRPSSRIGGIEDLGTDALNGFISVPRAIDVLRMADAYQGSGVYKVADGLSELLNGKDTVLLRYPVQNGAWLDAGKTYPVAVHYPVYVYDRSVGTRVVGVDQAIVSVTPFTSVDIAPVEAYAVVMSPALRARFHATAARIATLWAQAHGQVALPGKVFYDLPEGALGPFGEDWSVDRPDGYYEASSSHADARAAVAETLHLYMQDALVSIVVSEPMKRAHAHLLRRAGGKQHAYLSDEEASAYINTVMSFLQQYVFAALGEAGSVINSIVNDLRSDERTAAVLKFSVKKGGGRRNVR